MREAVDSDARNPAAPRPATPWRRLFDLTSRYSRDRNWLLLTVILRSIQLPALMWVVGETITGPIAQQDTRGIVWGAIAFLGVAVSAEIVLHFRERLSQTLGEALTCDLRNALFARLQTLPMSHYVNMREGRVISRVISDVEAVRAGLEDGLFIGFVQQGGQLIFSAAWMLWYDPILFLVVLGQAPVVWIMSRRFRQQAGAAHRELHESLSGLTAAVTETVNHIRVIHAFARRAGESQRFRAVAGDHAAKQLAVARSEGLYVPMLEWSTQLTFAALLVVGGYRVMQRDATTTAGDLVAFLLMAQLFIPPVADLGKRYSYLLSALAAAERVFELLDAPPQPLRLPASVPPASIAGRVEFRDLSFAYEPGRPVLTRLNLRIEPGQQVAIVGPTGAGKSTVARLLSQQWAPTSGELLIDGHDIRSLSSASLDGRIGLVSQDSYLFMGSVADNIRFGRPESSDEEISEALRSLECLDAMQALPRGLSTQVGEGGSKLSAGQRQLVCLARTMLINPRIVVLDEATNCIDPGMELQVRRALTRLLAGRTSIVIAHQLGAVQHADVIFVMQAGQIVERGRHAELLAANGMYRQLHQLSLRS